MISFFLGFLICFFLVFPFLSLRSKGGRHLIKLLAKWFAPPTRPVSEKEKEEERKSVPLPRSAGPNKEKHLLWLLKQRDMYICHFPTEPLEAMVGYDPTDPSNVALQSFMPIKMKTECVFARSARVWGSHDPWDSPLTLRAFSLFAAIQTQQVDGFAIAIPNRGHTIEDFAKCFHQVLSFLATNDPTGRNSLKSPYLGKRGWRFRFANSEFFVTSFAPCYDSSHSRFAFGVDEYSFILFQPYHSFLYHNIGEDTAHTNWDKPVTERDRIRIEYRNSGREYFIPKDPNSFPIARSFVPPLDHMALSDEEDTHTIKWWECPI